MDQAHGQTLGRSWGMKQAVPAQKFAIHIAAALVSSVSLLAIERAHATCAPAAPVNNTPVTCTGTTTNQNDPNGYGTGTETGLSINVDSSGGAATVSGTSTGISIQDGSVNNSTSSIIEATGTNGRGVEAFTVNLNNSGTIRANVSNGAAIGARNVNITQNAGTIESNFADGIAVFTFVGGSATVNNTTGNITANILGGVAISADIGATVTNGTGTITADSIGIRAKTVNVTGNSGIIEATGTTSTISPVPIAIQATTALDGTGGTVTVSNGDTSGNGVIRADRPNGIAIQGKTITVTGNTGTIEAGIGTGITGGVAIDARATGGTANVTTSGSIQASSIAIVTDGLLTLNNLGTGQITSGGAFAVRSINGDVSVNQSVPANTTTGSIFALANNAVAISAAGTATVANNGDGNLTGIIRGGQAAISAQTVKVTGNTGLIDAPRAGASAISAVDADITNDSGTIQANANVGGGSLSRAISATGNITLHNGSGTVQANGSGGIAVTGEGTVTVTNGTGVIRANGGRDPVVGGGMAISGNSVTVTANGGTIEANGNQGFAIEASVDANVTNSNTIQATGTGGIAVSAGGKATIDNAASGTITGNARATTAQTVNVTSNAGTIEATAAAAGGAGFAISGDQISVTNSGTIRETGAGGRAIAANVSANSSITLNNLAGGNIISDGAAITASNTINIVNAGTISSAKDNAVSSDGSAAVTNLSGGAISGVTAGISAVTTLDVTNANGATVSGGANAIQGSGIVRNAGTITGGTASVAFNGTGTNTLILQTGSVLNGDAIGSAASTTNQLVLQGHGTASTNFIGFNTLDVQADTAWVWNTTANFTGGATVSSGTLAVDGVLNGTMAVNSGGTLAGRGTVGGGDVTVASGGTIAPGAVTPFSTLTLGGNVTFNPGSIYRVNVNAAGQNDKLTSAAASLTGGTVTVLTQNGVMLGTPYTILTARTGLGGTQFAGVSGNSGFLTPTLTYDANDVFLTYTGAGPNGTVGFATAALTRNQRAVAGALDAAPTTNSLVGKLLTLTIDGARAAFDALSGEIFGSVQNTQAQEASFTRSGILGRLRQASYADAPGELGALGFAGPELAYADGRAPSTPADGKAVYGTSGRLAYAADGNDSMAADMRTKAPRGNNNISRDLTFWAQGLGGWGHADSDGNAASLKSRFAGFLSGVDMRFGDVWRAGLVAGYTRSDLNANARLSSAGIDSVTFGLYAGGKFGAFNLRTGGSFSYDSIDVSRSVFFPGFTDATRAHFHGQVGQVFGELGYGIGLGTFAIEPFAGLAYVHLQDGPFLESGGQNGGLAALSGSSAHESIGYSSLGIRAATFMPLGNGTVLVPRASAQWQHAFGDVTPTTALAFQSTGTAFTVAGLPIARDSALIEAGLDWRFAPQAKLGAFYQGELAAHAQSHAIKGGFTWDF
jgi:outer membrane autotransporter protein